MTAMCTRFTTQPMNAVPDSAQEATAHPGFDQAPPHAVHALLGAEPQTDESVGVGVEAADRHIGLVPAGVPHVATPPVAFQSC